MCCCSLHCILLHWSLIWELSVLLYCLMCSWKQKKTNIAFLFLFHFLLPIKLLPDAALNALKVPTAARCRKLLRNSCSPRLPPASDRQRLPNTSRPERNKSAACLTWRRTCVVCHFSFWAAAGGDFFSVFFVDASITSSSDCFKNTPVSLFSAVKSPPAVTVEWLNSLGYHI